jgi:hypothetical protein
MIRNGLITGKSNFVGETQVEAKVTERWAELSGPGVMRPMRCDSARQFRANAPTRMRGRNAMASRPDPRVPADLGARAVTGDSTHESGVTWMSRREEHR